MKLLNITVRNILTLIVVIALAVAVLWLVRGQSSTLLTTQANTPTLVPTDTPLPTAINTPMPTNVPSTALPSVSPQPTTQINSSLEGKDWLTYVDDISGISFQYPPEWEIFKSTPGTFVTFLHNERGHFVNFDIQENPNRLSPKEFLIEDRLKNRVSLTRSSVSSDIEQFSINQIQGAIYREKDSNAKIYIIFTYKETTIKLWLMIRGRVGGFPAPSDNYTPTEQEMFDLISSLQINP